MTLLVWDHLRSRVNYYVCPSPRFYYFIVTSSHSLFFSKMIYSDFAVTLQKIVDEIKVDPMFSRARHECLTLIAAVKTEPTASRLIKDSKKTWKRILSFIVHYCKS
jgi:hypothetical protein